MEGKLFNKIQHAITFISNHYGNAPRDYGYFETDYYQAYLRERFDIRQDVLDVINQLGNIPFSSIFTNENKKNFLKGARYLEGNCTTSSETHIGVHWEVSNMLYYYLVDKLENDIKSFVTLIKSQNFKETFLGFLEIEDNKVSYKMMVHEDIDAFIRERVPNYNQLVFIFHELTNYISIIDSRVVFKTQLMLELIEIKNNTFDFTEINIE